MKLMMLAAMLERLEALIFECLGEAPMELRPEMLSIKRSAENIRRQLKQK